MPQEQTQALRRVVTMNPVGQVVREVYGNQSEQYFDYNPSTWQMNLAGAHKPALGGQAERRYFDISYQYDLYGNLNQHEKSWDSQSQGGLLWARESFSYDLLHRLRETVRTQGSGAAGTGASTLGQESYTYAPNGNLLSKSDFGNNYTYVANRVQSVDLRDNGPTQRYEYDLNGNLQRVYVDGGIGGRIDRKLLNYDPYNKPLLIDDKVSGRRLEFAYGSNDQRFIQLKDLTGDYTVYIDKLFEAEGSSGTPNTDLEAKLYIGDYAVYDLTLTNNAEGPARAELNYLHRDRLGSVVAMSNSQGAVINMTGRGFDAFGKPREEGWQDSNHMNGADDNSGAGEPGDLNRNDLSTRGFTGHEHLNETDLIHMNGRVYDYNLGRFLSVDPFIQFPANSQSMNAYSYLMNNPLSGTDPSGYAVNSAIQECQATSGPGCDVGVGQNASLSGRLLSGLGRSSHVEDNDTSKNGSSTQPVVMGENKPPENIAEEKNRENMEQDEKDGQVDAANNENMTVMPMAGATTGSGGGALYGDLGLHTVNQFIDEFGIEAGAQMATDLLNSPDLDDVANIAKLRNDLQNYLWGIDGILYRYIAVGQSGTLGFAGAGRLGAVGLIRATSTEARLARNAARIPKSVRYGPTNPGPLNDAVAATFRGGSYTATTVAENTTLYRVYGGSAGKLGPYWSRTKPSGPLQFQLDSALAPQWGNTAQNVVSIRVPRGTTIYEGFAAPQSTGVGQILGGGHQVYIPRVDPKWIQ